MRETNLVQLQIDYFLIGGTYIESRLCIFIWRIDTTLLSHTSATRSIVSLHSQYEWKRQNFDSACPSFTFGFDILVESIPTRTMIPLLLFSQPERY